MKIKTLLFLLAATIAVYSDFSYVELYSVSMPGSPTGTPSESARGLVVTPSGIIAYTSVAATDNSSLLLTSNDTGTTWTSTTALTYNSWWSDIFTNSSNDLFIAAPGAFRKFTHTGAPTAMTWTPGTSVSISTSGSGSNGNYTVQDDSGYFWNVWREGYAADFRSNKSNDTSGATWGATVTITQGNGGSNMGAYGTTWKGESAVVLQDWYAQVGWYYSVAGAWQTPAARYIIGPPGGATMSIMTTTNDIMYYAYSTTSGCYSQNSDTGIKVFKHTTNVADAWDLFAYPEITTVNTASEVQLTTTGTDLWVFWTEAGTTGRNIYYRRYFDGAWADRVTLISDGNNNFKLEVPAKCFTGLVPLVWKEGSGSSYAVHKTKFLKVIVPPAVTACAPTTYDNAASQTITVTGKGFFGGTSSSNVTVVRFDDPETTSLTTLTVLSDTVLTGVAPALMVKGTYNIQVTNIGGTNLTSAVQLGVTSALPTPTITSFFPATSVSTSSATLSINGTGFNSVKKVQIYITSSTDLTNFAATSATVVTGAVLPANVAPGSYNLRVATAGGSGVAAAKYVVTPPVPVVSTVVPASQNNMIQLDTMVITGQYFFGNTATSKVQILRIEDISNPQILSFTTSNDSTIHTITVPAGYPPGTYNMKVGLTVSGMTVYNSTSAQKFILTTDLPTVTNVVPAHIYNTAGGTVVITGTGFYAGTNPTISTLIKQIDVTKSTGGAVTSNVGTGTVISDTQITGCVIPAGLPTGEYNLRVYNDGPNCNATSSVKVLVTTPPPVVNTIAPNSGKDTTPRTISVTGNGFFGGIGTNNVSSIKLVSTSESVTLAAGYSVVSDSQITNIIVPGGSTTKIESGAYDVIVTNTGGAGTSSTKYTCQIDSLDSADRDIIAGDTTITVNPGAFSADAAILLSKTVSAANQAAVTAGNAARYVNLKLTANLGGWVWDLKDSICEVFVSPATATINPNKEVTMAISFAALNINDSNVKKSIRVVTLNSNNRWELVEGTQTVDEIANTVTASIPHFSIFRLAQLVSSASSLEGVKVFPNPVDIGSSARHTVKFANLTLNPSISIYTISGELVVAIPPDPANLNNDGTSGKAEWDGKNTGGDLVQRGMYIYLIRDDAGRKKTGKIVFK